MLEHGTAFDSASVISGAGSIETETKRRHRRGYRSLGQPMSKKLALFTDLPIPTGALRPHRINEFNGSLLHSLSLRCEDRH